MEQQPLIIHFGAQWEGYTFRLHPLSTSWIESRFPERSRLASIYIGYDRKNRPEIRYLEPSVWEHVSTLLTGLSSKELDEIGGFVVVNSLTKEQVYHSLLVHA